MPERVPLGLNRAASGWMRLFAYTLVFLLIVCGAYYYVYVSEQEARMNEYYLRVLSTVSRNLEDALDGLWSNVRNAVNDKCDEGCGARLEANLEGIVALTAVKELDGDKPCGWPAKAAGEAVKTAPGVVVDWVRGKGALLFWGRPRSDEPERIVGVADLETLLKNVLPRNDFDAVLLTSERGAILASLTNRGNHLRVTELSSIVARELEPERELTNGAEERDLPAETPLFQTSRVVELDIAETSHRLYLQPLRLPIQVQSSTRPADATAPADDAPGACASSRETFWVLAGVHESRRFREETMRLSPTAVFGMAGLLLFALLALPFLKVRFMGVRSGLRSRDVVALAMASMAVAALFAFALMYGFFKRNVENQESVRLEKLAAEIQSSLDSELKRMISVLDEFDELRSCRRASRTTDPDASACLDLELECKSELSQTELLGIDCYGERLEKYPLFEMLIWMDVDGQQIEKWTIRKNTTPSINVSTRAYFSRHTKRDVWAAYVTPEKDGCQSRAIFVESVRSRNTGEESAVLSRRVCASPSNGAWLSAMVSRLASVVSPVLPSGYGFAVIDDAGKVLFHSNTRRNLRENLFEEMAPSGPLRAAIASRTNEALEATYHGVPVRLRAAPIESTPWTLVVTVEETWSLLWTVLRYGVLMLSAYLCVFLLYCLLIAHAKNCYEKPVTFFAWFWPDATRKAQYLRLVIGLSAIIVFWALLFFASPGDPTVVLLTVAMSLCALTFVQYKLRCSTTSWRGLVKDGRPAYFVTIFIVMAVFTPNLRALLGGNHGSVLAWISTLGVLTFILVVHRRLTTYFFLTLSVLPVVAFTSLTGTGGSIPTIWFVVMTVLVVVLLLVGLESSDGQELQEPDEKRVVSGRWWKELYWLSAVLLLVVVAVLPTVTFLSIAYEETARLSEKRRQLDYVRSYDAQSRSWAGRYQDVVAAEKPGDKLLGALRPVETSMENDILRLYTAGKLVFLTSSACGEGTCSESDGAPSTQTVVRWIAGAQGHTENDDLVSLASPNSDDGGWTWRSSGRWLVMSRPRFRIPPTLGFASDNDVPVDIHVVSALPVAARHWAMLTLLATGIVLIPLVLSASRFVFVMDMDPPRMLDTGPDRGWDDKAAGRRALYLRARKRRARFELPAQAHVIASRDVQKVSPKKLIALARKQPSWKAILVDELDEDLEIPAIAAKKLALVEGLARLSDRDVYLLAEIEPLYFLTTRAVIAEGAEGRHDNGVGRWARVLEDFVKVRDVVDRSGVALEEDRCFDELKSERTRGPTGDGSPSANEHEKRIDDLLRVLAKECWSDDHLKDLAKSLAKHERLRDMDPKSLIRQLQDLAEAYYRRLWSECTIDERMALYTIAKDGFANWQTKLVLNRLMRRQLVMATPNFRLINKSFRNFVLRAEPPGVIERWEKDVGVSTWSKVKAPLVLALLALAVFVVTTQRELVMQGAGLAVALTAVAPALVRLLALLGEQRPPGVTTG